MLQRCYNDVTFSLMKETLMTQYAVSMVFAEQWRHVIANSTSDAYDNISLKL